MDTPSAPRASPQDNAVNISGQSTVEVHGDLFGGNKYIGYTADQVRVLLADIRASYQLKSFDGRSPYVGLASFQEQDADRFFGREKLTTELVARIEHTRFLVIAGPSGSGKSSVARAGLMHTLRKGVHLNALTNAPTGTENWLYEILTPGRNPLTELARVVSSFTGKLQAGDELVNRGREDATLLHRWADIALGDQKTRRAILLVDQFEEVFTQVTDEAERAAFLNLLVYAATAENGRVTIVCCTRSDFIGSWVKYPNLNDLLRNGLYQIPPMQPDELVSAIARPALQVGLQIDPELVKQILDDMRDAPGALPLMQFALDDLFEYEKSKGGVIALTRDDYLERGGLQKALARHADAEFAKLNADEQQIARSVFAGLIEPGRGNVDTKRTALLSELVPAGSDTAQVKNVITKLADARLITTDQVNQHETVTLAHERLIDAWGWLRKLVDENREAIALQNQIAQDAQEWEQHKRDASYLYTGARLATAQEQVANKKIVLSALAQEFVDAGVKEREDVRKKEQRRTRRLIVAFGAAALVFAVLAIVAFLFQQQAAVSDAQAKDAAREEQARYLVAEGQNQFEANPLLGIRLGLEGLALVQDRAALQTALASSVSALMKQGRVLKIIDENNASNIKLDNVRQVYSSENRMYFVAVYKNGSAELRRSNDGSLIQALGTNIADSVNRINVIRFSPDPLTKYVAVFYTQESGNPTVTLYRSENGEQINLGGNVIEIDFSHDLAVKYIAVRHADKSITLFTMADGKSIDFGDSVSNIYLSPDPGAKHFATVNKDGSASLFTGPDSKPIRFEGIITRIQFSTDPGAKYLFLTFADGSLALYQNADGKLINRWENANDLIFSRDADASYFVVQFSDDEHTAALYISPTAEPIALGAESLDSRFSHDPAAKYLFVNHHDGITPADLYTTADGKQVLTENAGDDFGFSSDPAAKYVIVRQNASVTLYNSTDLKQIGEWKRTYSIEFTKDLKYAIIYSISNFSSTLLTDNMDRQVELGNDTREIFFDPGPTPQYFVVRYEGGTSTLYESTADSPIPLVDLNVSLYDPLYYDKEFQHALVHYSDGRAYLLDLDFLKEWGGISAQHTPSEIISLSCKYLFAPDKYNFDESQLTPYLNGKAPQACK